MLQKTRLSVRDKIVCKSVGSFDDTDLGLEYAAQRRIRTAPSRHCKTCRKKLAALNPEKYCFVCQEKRSNGELERLVQAMELERARNGDAPEGGRPPAPGPEPPEPKKAHRYKTWMRVLDIMGDNGPMTTLQVHNALGMTLPTIHNSIRLLKGAGLVEQCGVLDGGTKKTRLYRLTGKGWQVYGFEIEPPDLKVTYLKKAQDG